MVSLNMFNWKKLIQPFDDRRNIVIPGDKDETILFATKQFIAYANECISDHFVFSVALSGGSTPNAIYKLLSQEPYRSQVDWKKVFLFWSDERNVPRDDPESNYFNGMHSGLETLGIPSEQIFRMRAESDLEKGARNYEEQISTYVPEGRLDLVMLGMGEDGHTASLFPHTDGLNVKGRSVIPNYLPEKKVWRMTLTYERINMSNQVWIYVLGENKASMVKEALLGTYDPHRIPIQKVGTSLNKALWILDTDAASKLTK